MKKLILIVVLLVVAAGGGYVYVSGQLAAGSVPENVAELEQALIMPNTIGVASLDLAYVKRVDAFVNGASDPSPFLNPDIKESMLGRLKANGADIIGKTSYALAAGGVDDEGKPRFTTILVGNYTVDKVISALKKVHIVKQDKSGILQVQTENENTCKISDPIAVDVQPNRIVITSIENMPAIQKRLADKATAAIDIEKWKAFRHEKLFAMAVLDPTKSSSALNNPFIAGMIKKAEKEPMEAIYIGGVVNMLPPQGLKLLIDIKAKDAEWTQQMAGKFTALKAEYKDKIHEKMPTLAGLQQYLTVESKGDMLHVSAVADSNFISDVKKIPGEAMKLVFSGFGGKQHAGGKGDANKSKEQLADEKNFTVYHPTASFGQLPAFEVGQFGAPVPDAVTGPFGFTVEQVMVSDDASDVLEISIKASGEGFVNLSGESMHSSDKNSSIKFFITSAQDAEGNELLREENCGRERNQYPTKLRAYESTKRDSNNNTITSMKAEGEKKIRLKAGVKHTDVVKVSGMVKVEMATKTATKKIMAPLEGKVIETAEARMFLKSSPASNLSYDLSGKTHHFFDVRPLNAKGQYINSSSSSASGGGDSVRSVTKYVDGTIGGVEVVYATQTQTKEFPFEIASLSPKFKKAWGNPVGNTVKATSKLRFATAYPKVSYNVPKCYEAVRAVAGPFIVCGAKMESRWGREFGGDFSVYAPASASLKSNLSGVELFIDEVTMTDGKRYPFKHGEVVPNLETKTDDKKIDYLAASYVRVYKDDKAGEFANAKAKTIKGRIKVKLPRKIYRLPLDANVIGQKKRNKAGIAAEFRGFKDSGTAIIRLQGPIKNVVQVRPKDAAGKVMPAKVDIAEERTFGFFNKDKKDEPKKYEARVKLYAQPASLDILYAKDFDLIEYPFELEFK